MWAYADAEDTIAALATPQGAGAIGVIRVSGKRAFQTVNQLLSKPVSFEKQARKAYLRQWMDQGQPIDEILVTGFPGPHSFTGEDTVELAFHGSPYILRRALKQLADAGVRPATAGEFTKRAFLHGKMDLAQAEAVADLISASSRAAAQLAMQHMRGGFSQQIRNMREKLLEFTALVELELDFAEEDVEFANRTQLIELLSHVRREVQQLAASYAKGQVLKSGVSVAIVGAPNAGKSTLLNALVKEERALVSDIPGTTRDTVEDVVQWGSVSFRFIDTAGIRDTEDTIEHMGIQRSLAMISKAQVVLHLADLRFQTPDEVQAQAAQWRQQTGATNVWWLHLATQTDQPSSWTLPEGWMAISSATGAGLDSLKETLVQHYETWLHGDETLVTQARHAAVLDRAEESLGAALEALSQGVSGEFMAMELRAAIRYLSEIVGDMDIEEVLGAIFGRFCIGK